MTDEPAPAPSSAPPGRQWAGWTAWVLVHVACLVLCVNLVTDVSRSARADASVVGRFADPGDGCPDRVAYVVEGVTYEIDTGARGWCSREDGDPTSPQRVFYDGDDPGVAVLADPVGTTPTVVLDVVALVLVAVLVGWLQWLRRTRLRPWWRRTPSR